LKYFRGTLSIILLTTLAVGFGLGSVTPLSANTNQAGSANDPIVTKSYVDFQVKSLVKEELSKQTVNTDEINRIINNFKKELEQQSKSSSDLTVVTVPKGQVLYAGAGTEFIVRAGEAIAFSNDGNGIPNLTAGKDIANGEKVEKNHLLLFPREGRGIKPNTDGGLIVMVRGNYLLLDLDETS
jgi:hypothetical protein